MRRDYFTLTVRPRADSAGEPPELVVTYEGPAETLAERMRSGDRELRAEDVDVAYRYRDGDEAGVVSVTNRLTGEFILEVNAEATAIQSLVRAAREVPGETTYTVVIEREDGETLSWAKETLLVYDAEGTLVREHSLIPSGVEL